MIDSVEEMAEIYKEYLVEYDDFELHDTIGSGGFSEVFSATYLPTGQKCAVKKLKFKEIKNDEFNLYYREIEILTKLNHPYCLNFIGFSVHRPFIIVTELLQKGSLYDALHWKDSEKPLNGTQKTIIAMCIASGMERLHKLNIIHRDLKSLNILLDNDKLPRIIDFGLSREVSETDAIMTMQIGTPHWMAPELFTSQPYSFKVDVYAYGMLLWEMVANTQPFKGKTAAQIMYEVVEKGSRPPISSRCPSGLKALINACWAQDPEQRPSFHQIYKAFCNGTVFFEGSKQTKVDDIVRKNQTLFMTRGEYQTHYSVKDKRKFVSRSGNDDSQKFNSLMDIESKTFEPSFTQIINHFSQEMSSRFFMTMKKIFNQQIPSQKLILILKGIEKIISQDPKIFKSFVNSELYQKFTFKDAEIVEPLFGIFLNLFTISPNNVTSDIMSSVEFYIPIVPEKVLRLLNILTSHKKIQQTHQLFISAIDIMFRNAVGFIKAGSSKHLLQLIFTLMKQSKDLDFKNIEKVIVMVLEKNDETAEFALDVLLNSPSLKINIPADILSSLLQNEKLLDKTLFAIVQTEQDLQDSSLTALINAAKKSKFATLCLCQSASNESIAIRLAKLGKSWLLEDLPNLEGTLRLLMSVMQHEQARSYLPVDVSHPLLLAVSTTLFKYVYPIFMKLKVTDSLLNSLGNDFLVRYFAIAFQNGAEAIISALSITDKIARCGFFRGFIGVIPFIKKLFENEKWKKYAIPTIAELSIFEEMRSEFTKQNIEYPKDAANLF